MARQTVSTSPDSLKLTSDETAGLRAPEYRQTQLYPAPKILRHPHQMSIHCDLEDFYMMS
jgi:hypothetical protein